MAEAGLFEEEELKSFREEFGHFSEEDLLLAIKQARLEIFEDLRNYQVIDVITEKAVRSRPAASVSLPSRQVGKEEVEEASTSEDLSDSEQSEDSYSQLSIKPAKTTKSRPEPSILKSQPKQNPVQTGLLKKTAQYKVSPKKQIANKSEKTEKSLICRCFDQIDEIFNDIFAAVEVNLNYAAADVLEQERAARRVKEFNSRFGRSLYQAKQNLAMLRSVSLKSHLRNAGPGAVEARLVQLLGNCRSLLSSYLHFIPLSGGNLFPALLSDALELLVDAGSAAASLGFPPTRLAAAVRRLEQLSARPGVRGGDPGRLEMLNSLARNTFGPPDQRNKRSPVKKRNPGANQSSTLKPRGTKLLQARTNLARMRRMEDYEKRSEASLLSTRSAFPLNPRLEALAQRENRSEADCSVSEKKEGREGVAGPLPGSSVRNPQQDNLAKRIHNLELLAAAGQSNNTRSHGSPRLNAEKDSSNTESFQYLVNRLDIIQSDFELIQSKYQKRKDFSDFKSRAKYDQTMSEHYSTIRKNQNENKPKSLYNKDDPIFNPDSTAIVEDIVNKIADEILESDFISHI